MSPLSGLALLEHLRLGQHTSLTSLAPLATCTALTFPVLCRCDAIPDLGPLASLRMLKVLEIADCTGIASQASLATCTALTNLSPRRTSCVFEGQLGSQMAFLLCPGLLLGFREAQGRDLAPNLPDLLSLTHHTELSVF